MSEWQPIATAPKQGDVLVWSPPHHNDVVRDGDYSVVRYDDGSGWHIAGNIYATAPTHWMPLPEPPNA